MSATCHIGRPVFATDGTSAKLWEASYLPDGTVVDWNGAPHLVLGNRLLPYTPGGYEAAVLRPGGPVAVLAPKPTVVVLAQGYRHSLHDSACSP
ncbi:MAG: hypothetical protein HUJ27_05015 [Rhodobacteraceae bacterium]|nr:hypothetical protein [Paracoccaceae bacterium]